MNSNLVFPFGKLQREKPGGVEMTTTNQNDDTIEVLTPLAAAILAGVSTEAVRVATAQASVHNRLELLFGKHPIRLIGLESAVAYWEPDEAKVEELRKQPAVVLEANGERYRILYPVEQTLAYSEPDRWRSLRWK